MNKSKLRLNVLVLVLLIALVITSVVSAAPKDGPTVKLSVAQGDFSSEQDVLVSVTISNPTKHTVRILKWFTPVDGMEEPLFFVLRDGEPVSYIGAIYKRPAATGKDYMSLKAGASITSVVNLAQYYDLSVSGQYEVSYAVTTYNLFNEKGNAFKIRDALTSDPITFKSNGRPTKRPTPTPTPPPPGGLNTFNACTTDQQAVIASARDQATTYAEDSSGYLNTNKTGLRYTTWFGVYDLTRYNTVTNHFDAITDAFNNGTINFDCKCKGSSPISLSSRVPPSANSSNPRFLPRAPVNAPASWPKSSDSASSGGMAAQLMAKKGPFARFELACITLAR